jgi:hypothetical protein
LNTAGRTVVGKRRGYDGDPVRLGEIRTDIADTCGESFHHEQRCDSGTHCCPHWSREERACFEDEEKLAPECRERLGLK